MSDSFKMEEKLVSVIVPTYNPDRERFGRCIRSICSQDYKHLEIVVVDDGSDEEHKKTIDDIALNDERIVVYHKINEGPGIARNYGVEKAAGVYIIFVDSDDYILPTAINDGMSAIKQYDADMVIGMVRRGSLEYLNDQHEYKGGLSILIETQADREKFVNHLSGYSSSDYLLKNGYLGDGPVSRLVKRDVALNAKFPMDRIWAEDTIWNYELAYFCKRIVLVDKFWYAYVINEKSMTQGFRSNCVEEFNTRIFQEWGICHNKWPGCIKGFSVRIWRDISILCHTYIFNPKADLNVSEQYRIYKEAIHRDEYVDALKHISFEYDSNMAKRLIQKICVIFSLHSPNWISFVIWRIFCYKLDKM